MIFKAFICKTSISLLMMAVLWPTDFGYASSSTCDQELSATAVLLKTRIGQWERAPEFRELLAEIRSGERASFDEGIRLYEWLSDEKRHRRLPPAFHLVDLLSPPFIVPAVNWIRSAVMGFNRTQLKAQLLQALVEARLTKNFSLEPLIAHLHGTLQSSFLHLDKPHLRPVVASDISELEVWALIALAIEGDSILLTEGLFRAEGIHELFRQASGPTSSGAINYFVLMRGLKHLIHALSYHPDPAATLLLIEFLVLGKEFYAEVKQALLQRPGEELDLIELSDYENDPLWINPQRIRTSLHSPNMDHYISLTLDFGPGLPYVQQVLTESP